MARMKLKDIFPVYYENVVMCIDCMKKFPEGELIVESSDALNCKEFCPFCGSSHIMDVDDDD